MTRLGLLLCLVALAGCEGSITGIVPPSGTGGGSGGGDAQVDPCLGEASPGPGPLRRLSHDEYVHSVGDLFANPAVGAVAATQALGFTSDPTSLGFRNSANFLAVKSVLLQQYMEAAEQVAAEAVKDLPALLPCQPANAGEEAACASQYISTFGRQVYRRALAADEQQALETVYTQARTRGDDFKTGIEWVTYSFLLSPGFLYRAEEEPTGGVRAVTPLELATRLSYLIWRSAPDEALLAAAEQGRLVTSADVEREARRMLEDPKAERLISFFDEWLDLDDLPAMTRDATAYPNLNPNLPALFREEAHTTIRQVVFSGDSTWATLLSQPVTYVNAELAQHYGLSGVSGAGWQKVGLPAERLGLFMSGGVLTGHDKQTRTSIVGRGIKVRTQLLCQMIPAPPDNVPALGPIDQNLTQRDRLAEHRADPACAGCHNLIDPLGQTFENFDAVGRVRTVDEVGRPVLTTGEVTGARDSAGPVASGKEMMERFAHSDEVNTCLVTQFFRYSMGRIEEDADACSQHRLTTRFLKSGGNIKDLVVGLTQTDAFLLRGPATP